jgi:hypothetical protein
MDELLKELDDLESREFMTQMADHLSSEDYRFLDELHQRKMAIKRELKEKYDYIA